MIANLSPTADRFALLRREQLEHLPQLAHLPRSERDALRAVAHVLPFAVNRYVVDELIDWSRAPQDPLFQLTFPQREMLAPADFERMYALVRRAAPSAELRAAAREIQTRLNPHPAGQTTLNRPATHPHLKGVQHKYRETVLFFPSRGQTCFSYCTYCFRWPQFVGLEELKFAASEADGLADYLRSHREVSDVLITGGDPLVMRAEMLERYLEPLLAYDLGHLTTLRIGTKALAFWPQRFLDDPDADRLLALFERVVKSGRHLAFMAHFSHPRELETASAQAALARVLATGAVVRTQAPLIRRVNDSPEVWERMWREQVRLGAVPYYMFVERDTGPRQYFEVPLERCWRIFREAYSAVSGLARSVRGPSMSATPGKVVVDGVSVIGSEQVFALRFLQARRPEWVGRPFFARFDAQACWFDQLEPAFGREEFFFQPAMEQLAAEQRWRTQLRPAASPRAPSPRAAS